MAYRGKLLLDKTVIWTRLTVLFQKWERIPFFSVLCISWTKEAGERGFQSQVRPGRWQGRPKLPPANSGPRQAAVTRTLTGPAQTPHLLREGPTSSGTPLAGPHPSPNLWGPKVKDIMKVLFFLSVLASWGQSTRVFALGGLKEEQLQGDENLTSGRVWPRPQGRRMKGALRFLWVQPNSVIQENGKVSGQNFNQE